VFDVADGKVTGREVRDNTYTAHAKGECKEGEHHHDQPHSHADIIAALHDCEVVLCGGMGWRAAEDLQAKGIRPVMIDAGLSPNQAAQDFLDGKLKPGSGLCRCHE
jgi:predicted Fe-Mo cluster-binding NifX family protein